MEAVGILFIVLSVVLFILILSMSRKKKHLKKI